MNYPDFFNKIPTIKLQDELSSFLGAFENGIIEFSYLDIVKSAGHSCPTVLGAYLMTYKALTSIYENELPKRGNIKVEFNDKQNSGVTGVISNVISNITGATTDTGFKGIGGNFDRRFLMGFEKGNLFIRESPILQSSKYMKSLVSHKNRECFFLGFSWNRLLQE